jgi:prolyl-tRNA editing enzyme YbaK/EbsC (Cys-tRNA(Pro) deacylase)
MACRHARAEDYFAIMTLSDSDLGRFLLANNINAELVYPNAPTPTVPAAAKALDVPVSSIVKSLIFLGNEQPQVVIAAGESRISYKRLRDVLGVSRRKLRMASPEEALALTGFEVGAMPPFGHLQTLPTLVDSLTVQGELLYGGGGTKAAMLKLSLATLLEVTGARCLPLTQEAGEG